MKIALGRTAATILLALGLMADMGVVLNGSKASYSDSLGALLFSDPTSFLNQTWSLILGLPSWIQTPIFGLDFYTSAFLKGLLPVAFAITGAFLTVKGAKKVAEYLEQRYTLEPMPDVGLVYPKPYT